MRLLEFEPRYVIYGNQLSEKNIKYLINEYNDLQAVRINTKLAQIKEVCDEHFCIRELPEDFILC